MSATAEFGVRFPASSLKRSRLARRGLASYPPPGSSHARRDRSKVDTVVALARTRSRRPTGDTTPRDLSRGPLGRYRQRIAVPSRRSSTPHRQTTGTRLRSPTTIWDRACADRPGLFAVSTALSTGRTPATTASHQPARLTAPVTTPSQEAALPSPPPSPAKPPFLRRLDALTDLAHRCHGLLLGPTAPSPVPTPLPPSTPSGSTPDRARGEAELLLLLGLAVGILRADGLRIRAAQVDGLSHCIRPGARVS
jgi:hypothetical protein